MKTNRKSKTVLGILLALSLAASVSTFVIAASLSGDDFNRADGEIGPSWTEQEGSFTIAAGTVTGDLNALATYNDATSNKVEIDVAIDDAVPLIQYAAIVLAYKDISTNVFLEVKDHDHDGLFDQGGFLYGNNMLGRWPGNEGLFDLDAPFSTAHMTAEIDPETGITTITLTNIDGTGEIQVYSSNVAPPDYSGTDIGIGAFNARIDNFQFEQEQDETKAGILARRGVPGKGTENAPGLQKPFNPESKAAEHAGKKEKP